MNKKGCGLYVKKEYSGDRCEGGSVSADRDNGGAYPASRLVDGIVSTAISQNWYTGNTSMPHWAKYDFGVGISYAICKARFHLRAYDGHAMARHWNIDGSNNNVDWTNLASGEWPDSSSYVYHTEEFANSTKYRYVRWYFTSTWHSNQGVAGSEMEFMDKVETGEKVWLPVKVDTQGRLILSS